jgi:hypothetical protein
MSAAMPDPRSATFASAHHLRNPCAVLHILAPECNDVRNNAQPAAFCGWLRIT